jgi:hypothetical protein
MKLLDIFETRIEEKIDPVIKVGEIQDEAKLASEIGAYVVTPTIEKHVDEFLEHFTDTIRVDTTEIGSWIAGYFGSGKSHLAKILALLVENRTLVGHTAAKRFEGRVPTTAPRRDSILRSLGRVGHATTKVLAFNLNTLVDSRKTELPKLLLSQYYLSRGYSSNLLFARVIEQELDQRGKLDALHGEVARLAGRPWSDVQKNPNFYAKHLYQAASALAPEAFGTPEDVAQALRNAEKGDIYNAQLLVTTLLDDLRAQEAATKKPARILLVLDESGQWIEDDAGRLAQLQAFVEEASSRGRGKIWIFVTTHEDMGAVYTNAMALDADFKKIEGRFRFKVVLTTENIELSCRIASSRRRSLATTPCSPPTTPRPACSAVWASWRTCTARSSPPASATASRPSTRSSRTRSTSSPRSSRACARRAGAASSSPARPGPCSPSPRTSSAPAAAPT